MGVTDRLLSDMPLWLVGVLVFALVLAARYCGTRVYRWRAGKPGHTPDTEDYVVAGVLGLLAFMIGITFSIATERFETRRALVIAEANAIETAYLRTQLLDEPHRRQLLALLHQYARVRAAPENLSAAEMAAGFKRGEALHAKLWNATVVAVWRWRDTDLGSSYTEAMNEMLNLAAARKIAGFSHIPTAVIELLLLFTVAAAAITGFLDTSVKGHMRPASTVLFGLFTLAIMLIVDIDSPRSGAIMVSQRPIQDLVAMMDRDAPRAAQSAPASAASPQ